VEVPFELELELALFPALSAMAGTDIDKVNRASAIVAFFTVGFSCGYD
jgi:hypothetical protein